LVACSASCRIEHPAAVRCCSFAAVESDHTLVELRLVEAALRPGSVVLDAGCGRTTRLRFYRDRIARLVGIDVDDAAGRENPWLDEFLPANLDDELPFADESFDLVYANFVVEHLSEPSRTFAEWWRVLRPDGRLVLLTSNRANPVMALADRLPDRARVAVKRRGAGVEERDVYPARYRANTPQRLAEVAAGAGFVPVSVNFVGTLHRYGARVPGLGPILVAFERALPAERRSTIVASYTRAPRDT
jgi:SAM-dependent methyltransferase